MTTRSFERRFAALLDNLDVIAWEAETSTLRTKYVSEGSTRILGYPPSAWLDAADFFSTHLHEADRALTLSLCRAVASDGAERRAAFRLMAADGSPRWIEMLARRGVDASGAPSLQAMMLDLSRRVEARKVLDGGEPRTRLLLEQLPLILWTTDRDFRFTSGAGAGLAKLGLRADVLVGVPLSAYFHGPGTGEHSSLVATRRALNGEASSFDSTWGGRAYQTHVEPFRDAGGTIIGTLGIALDVTERKEEEQATRRLEAERDHLLVEERVARAAAEDAERRACFLAEASRILGESLDHVQTLESVSHLAVPALADWAIVDVLEGNGTMRRLAWGGAEQVAKAEMHARVVQASEAPEAMAALLHVGPAAIFAEDAALPAHVEDARALGIHSLMWVPLVARGRTLGGFTFGSRSSARTFSAKDLALAEELAQRAAIAVDNARLYREARLAVAVRDEFLSIAAHELRTPCTSLLLGVQSLRRMGRAKPLDDAPAGYLDRTLATAERQTRNLTRLVDKLLDASRIQAGHLVLEPETFDLCEVVRASIDDFHEEAERDGSAITLHAEGKVVGLWDRVRIEQVVVNLLSNALKYGDGKPIDVVVEAKGPSAELTVRDRGIGVSHEKLPQIFERFGRAVSSSHYGGLGLGLYIVRRIVESHGGIIACESTLGEGSVFRVTLPRAPSLRAMSKS